ncbi:MAG: radical SAM protein, partial [Candidatus Caldatribacterium sp.]|nr:radical SAM protein [Candidatus Caldatribacterium sp.]
SKVLRELRNRSLYRGHCGVCAFRAVCGGCRARAYAYFGDYLGPDPGCVLNTFACRSFSEAPLLRTAT